MPISSLVSLLAAVLLAGCARPAPPPPDSLAGTAWRAESIGGRGVVDRLQSTLRFDGTGSVAGSAGCNQFSGSYETDGAALSFGALGMTKRMCPPAVMAQERAFSDALGRTAQHTISDEGFLLLADADGVEVLRFTPHDGGAEDTSERGGG